MTDLEMTRLCAEAMGDDAWTDINGRWYCEVRGQETLFDPLRDRAQAMDLVEKLNLSVDSPDWRDPQGWTTWRALHYSGGAKIEGHDRNLLRAICLCAARVQLAKDGSR